MSNNQEFTFQKGGRVDLKDEILLFLSNGLMDFKHLTNEMLRQYFDKFGKISKIIIFETLAMIEYVDYRDANDAYLKFDMDEMDNILSSFAPKDKHQSEDIYNYLTVEKFGDLSGDKIQDIFSRYGTIDSVHIGQHKILIKYDDVRDAQDALHDLNLKKIGNNTIKIETF